MADGSSRAHADRGSLPVLLVSACLLGVRCNHEASCTDAPHVAALAPRYRLVPVCPETAGGLPTPRTRAELGADGRVRTEAGDDVTDAYERGSAHAVHLAASTSAVGAVLKARSPSCGVHQVYDGTFRGRRVAGAGVTAAALQRAGLPLYDESDVAAGALD